MEWNMIRKSEADASDFEFRASERPRNTDALWKPNKNAPLNFGKEFSLSVVNLNCIDLATEEDHASHLVEWAKMFKAKTWEELRMLAEKNPAIDEAVTKIFTLTQEDIIREQMEAEELYYLSIQKRDEAITKKDEVIAKKDEEIARKDALIEKSQLEIDRLKSIIAANNIKLD